MLSSNNKLIGIFLTLLIPFTGYFQEKEYIETNVKVNRFVEGTLVTPYSDSLVPLVIFVMDSGEINRDGNDRLSRNDTFKKLAVQLSKKGIATFRYDKRLLIMDRLGIQIGDLSIQNFTDDVKTVVDYFYKNNEYSSIILTGHGQGSLVAMHAMTEKVDGFISIGGNANTIDQIIIAQLQEQAPGLDKNAARAFAELKVKGRAITFDPALSSIFAYEVQPFMRTWMQLNPADIIKDLSIPVLILQGDKDLQVSTDQAFLLKEANPDAELHIIKDMNHILRETKAGRIANHKSYNEHWTPIMPEVLQKITNFISETDAQKQ
ncbi:alpha/beta hydrolase [Aquimarina sp. ERC-38]|uniref:alpha/beta hydrolase family protein n=1 Tax=Aquimarina sp. ERC-38 TaxID=2949996 RepID=UPI0022468167|nr:alpha/beta hydrolase [Aquimarina sp. ERC-38]UZO79414.1 alpha/beta hydrolase [Aquimarina sp. ERC-38]